METNMKKIKITIDGKELLLDQEFTILSVARQNNIHIPTLCHHPDLSAWGGCRICVVEVDGSPKLAASCVTPVRDGMEIVTSNEQIIESRRTILEFIFAERNHNCMFCPRSGECELQTLAYELQMDHLTICPSYDRFPTDITGQYMGFDHNRCILCGRCVRACKEISGASVLNFINRGSKNLIGFDFNETREGSTCHQCGACLQLCPTGAIFNRYRSHYAVKGHEAEKWHKVDSLCPICGLLCPTTVTLCNNNIVKVEGEISKEADRADRGQLCYRGRFEVLETKGERLTSPLVRNSDGGWEKIGWEGAVDLAAQRLNAIREKDGGGAIFGVASSLCSNENLGLFKDLMVKGLGSESIDTFDGTHFRTLMKTRWQLDGGWKEASWKIIPEADFILVIGATPHRSQPLIQPLIHRTALEHGTAVAFIGKSDNISPFTSWHLPVNSGDEPLVARAILRDMVDLVKEPSRVSNWKEIYGEVNSVDSAEIIDRLGLDSSGTKGFHEMVNSFASSVNPLIVTGEGVTGLKDPSGLHDLINLSLLKGALAENVLRIVVLKPCGNSAGAWQLGVASTMEPSYSERMKGGVLLLSGEREQPLHALSKSVDNIDFLALLTPLFPEPLPLKADILIPTPLWMEEDGTCTSLDGSHSMFRKKVVLPLDGVRDTGSLLLTLAEKVGFIQP